jgi:hypothetical protein
VLRMGHVGSRAPSWILRGARRIGALGLQRDFSMQAEQSALLAR